jgi:hypothetical protein
MTISDKLRSPLLSVEQAAEYLCCGVSTLNKLRVSGGGPIFVKIGARVSYRVDDLDRYIDQHRQKSTAQRAKRAENADGLSKPAA